MTRSIRTVIFWLALAALFAYSGWAIFQAESAIAKGQTVLVQLAPVDPRSLMQGDYMTLGYALPPVLRDTQEQGTNGILVATVDADHVATFVRAAASVKEPLGENEFFVRYSYDYGRGGRQMVVGTNAFFFEEGTAELYEDAAFGEFKVTADGTAYLIGLRDEELNRLGG